MTEIYGRQGDLVVDHCDTPPLELAVTTTPTVIAGSHEGTHTLPAGVEYGHDDRIHYVRPATDCAMTHASRHDPLPLKAGQIYKIWPQIERHGDGDADVED